MADIQINTSMSGLEQRIIINGVDFSTETYRDFELVEVDNEVGFRVTFAVSKLSIDTDADIPLTDCVPTVAARVRSISEDVA